MDHETFPVENFSFMDDDATSIQKDLIVELCQKRKMPIDRNGKWPDPFTKWDAARMIDSLGG